MLRPADVFWGDLPRCISRSLHNTLNLLYGPGTLHDSWELCVIFDDPTPVYPRRSIRSTEAAPRPKRGKFERRERSLGNDADV